MAYLGNQKNHEILISFLLRLAFLVQMCYALRKDQRITHHQERSVPMGAFFTFLFLVILMGSTMRSSKAEKGNSTMKEKIVKSRLVDFIFYRGFISKR